ncbi:MAG: hypothetical protein HC887_08220 [Desulfobacteraceae bacterium]|nr:hypothetical protein [Desulfobacteraceae bacterium]
MNELSSDLSELPIDESMKKDMLKLIAESAASSDKDKIGSVLEKSPKNSSKPEMPEMRFSASSKKRKSWVRISEWLPGGCPCYDVII